MVEEIEKTALEKRVEYKPKPVIEAEEAAKRLNNYKRRKNGRHFREDKPAYIAQLEQVLAHRDFPAGYGTIIVQAMKRQGKIINRTQVYSARKGVAVHWDILIEMGKLVGMEIKVPPKKKKSKVIEGVNEPEPAETEGLA